MTKSHEDSMEHNYSSRQFSVFALVSVCVVLLGGLFVLTREYSDAMGRRQPLVKMDVAAQPVATTASTETPSPSNN